MKDPSAREKTIISLLKENAQVTRKLMCEVCACSPKTAQRSIEKLRSDGWVINSSYQGYSLDIAVDTPIPPSLDEKYGVMMMAGCSIDRSIGVIMSEVDSSITDRPPKTGDVEAVRDAQLISKSCDALSSIYSQELIERFNQLARSIVNEDAICFNYPGTGKKSYIKQNVFPLQLKLNGPTWSLMSLDLKKHTKLEHNLVKIKDLAFFLKDWIKPSDQLVESVIESTQIDHTETNFLNQSIITYLGNKRKLLPFINHCVKEVITQDLDMFDAFARDIKIFDIFSGSGVVSRLFRSEEYTTYANDLEDYTIPINTTFLETNEGDLAGIFEGVPKKLALFYKSKHIRSVLSESGDAYRDTVQILNSVPAIPRGTRYYSKHYSATSTANPKIGSERLFFTQQNGLFIDAVLDVIFDEDIFTEKARHIILADLLAQMSIYNNTSGIMKSFHKGWGGKKKNALKRITGDIQLDRLDLLTDEPKGKSFNTYAEKVFIENPDLRVDIIYADPPYNQHQYSSNYHLLTTAFRNRDYKVPAFGKGNISGIRTDHNKSGFCSKPNIEALFTEFISSVENHTKYLLVSYNHKGFITPTRMIEILSQGGIHTVSVESSNHEKYKGGRGKNAMDSVIEYIFVVQMNTPQNRTQIDALMAKAKLEISCLYWTDKAKKEGFKLFDPAESLEEAEAVLAQFKAVTDGEELLVAKELKELVSPDVKEAEITKIAKRLGIYKLTNPPKK